MLENIHRLPLGVRVFVSECYLGENVKRRREKGENVKEKGRKREKGENGT